MLPKVYSDLATYLKPYNYSNDFLTRYFTQYKYCKVINSISEEMTQMVAEQSVKREYNVWLQPRSVYVDKLEKKPANSVLYFMDAMGAEYLGYLQSKCFDNGLEFSANIARCNLPSITSTNKEFEDDFQHAGCKVYSNKNMDELKHAGTFTYDYEDNKYPIHIVEEIDRESKIIDDLLSLVKMDKSSMTLNISSVNINELLELILKRLKPIAQKKNIELLFESFRPVVAEIDEVKFTIAISNLVENAIKYNRDDGWVHVSLNADHRYFYVRVEDNGIGIPQESQKMVFERFYRVDKARSRQTGGTGLGLSIVRNAVLMHHGAIRLHSEEDVGTTFTVRIPLNYVPE